MKFELDTVTGECANCRHSKLWCICDRVPEDGTLVFSIGSEGATGWTKPVASRTYRADSVVVNVNSEEFKCVKSLPWEKVAHKITGQAVDVVRKNTEDAIRASLPPGEYTIPAGAAVAMDEYGRVTADLSQARPVRKPVPARPPWRLVNVDWSLRCRDGITEVVATFDVLAPECVDTLCRALYALGERPLHPGMAPELAAPYDNKTAAPTEPVARARWLQEALDRVPDVAAQNLLAGRIRADERAQNAIACRDAYATGVAAAREAIAAAKYDAERDHREWSVREVVVPEWTGK